MALSHGLLQILIHRRAIKTCAQLTPNSHFVINYFNQLFLQIITSLNCPAYLRVIYSVMTLASF